MTKRLHGSGTAYAKINISLDIIARMGDGYHNMKMVMQTVGLCDGIEIECIPGEGASVESGLSYLPGDERNIAAKAALAFFRYTGVSGYHARIKLHKVIPVCAGLGGGSADGACVLRVLDRLFETRLGCAELEAIGGSVGSDVPFCVAGGTVLAEGRGDEITMLPPIPECHIVICKPPFANSTPELFKRIKCDRIRARPDTDGIIKALHNGCLNDIARRMYNVFEDVLPYSAREIDEIKGKMLDGGALGAIMTGTGPAVFGVFNDATSAEGACTGLKKEYKECYMVQPVSSLNL